jgi:hypothetical protein
MTGLIFLVVALGLSVAGSCILWLRYRKPTSISHAIDSFQKEMQALAPHPPAPDDPPGRRGTRS